MICDAEAAGGPQLAKTEDARVTRVGKWLRKCRLDEIPQLWNIFKGEMSVVGPRPERPELAAEYEKQMPEFSFRLQVKAGLTGYAQVVGLYDTTPYDKLKMDLMYIENYSLLLDLQILLMTVKTALFPSASNETLHEQTHIPVQIHTVPPSEEDAKDAKDAEDAEDAENAENAENAEEDAEEKKETSL
jgi:lipopolysaccharide/colanic/teichoic acid biosynthesis glycosyltransferase